MGDLRMEGCLICPPASPRIKQIAGRTAHAPNPYTRQCFPGN
jgi:hypothetical protein